MTYIYTYNIYIHEVLFQPNLVGREADGVHLMTFQSIMKSDVDVRRDLSTTTTTTATTTNNNNNNSNSNSNSLQGEPLV